jgi:hypothetical protein
LDEVLEMPFIELSGWLLSSLLESRIALSDMSY